MPSPVALKRHEGSGTVLLILVPSLPRTTTAKWGATKLETFSRGRFLPATTKKPESREAGIWSTAAETERQRASIRVVRMESLNAFVVDKRQTNMFTSLVKQRYEMVRQNRLPTQLLPGPLPKWTACLAFGFPLEAGRPAGHRQGKVSATAVNINRYLGSNVSLSACNPSLSLTIFFHGVTLGSKAAALFKRS